MLKSINNRLNNFIPTTPDYSPPSSNSNSRTISPASHDENIIANLSNNIINDTSYNSIIGSDDSDDETVNSINSCDDYNYNNESSNESNNNDLDSFLNEQINNDILNNNYNIDNDDNDDDTINSDINSVTSVD